MPEKALTCRYEAVHDLRVSRFPRIWLCPTACRQTRIRSSLDQAVRSNPSNRMFIGMKADAGMVHYTNITLKDCIRVAYRVRDFQIQGGGLRKGSG